MQLIHLVRHGEVANPNHVVYADLPGFNLSPLGVLQAHATGRHLSDRPISIVLSSPLARAVQTATAIARHHGLAPVIDHRLTETGQYPGWTGQRWEDLDELFPGQLEAYLADATVSTDADESIEAVAARGRTALVDVLEDGTTEVVAVGHQDPTQATRLSLTGRPLSSLLDRPPGHGSVTTLERHDRDTWREIAYWEPWQALSSQLSALGPQLEESDTEG